MTIPPGFAECLALLFLGLALVAYWTWRNCELLRAHTTHIADFRIHQPKLESMERNLMEKIDREFRELERQQSEREENRMRLLLESAGQVGSVKGVTELLTGLLAQMSAKLDRQIGLNHVPPAIVAASAPPTA